MGFTKSYRNFCIATRTYRRVPVTEEITCAMESLIIIQSMFKTLAWHPGNPNGVWNIETLAEQNPPSKAEERDRKRERGRWRGKETGMERNRYNDIRSY